MAVTIVAPRSRQKLGQDLDGDAVAGLDAVDERLEGDAPRDPARRRR